MAEGTKVLKCICVSVDQDAMYGKGMRVHNIFDSKKSATNQGKGKCTVCGNIRADSNK